MLVNVLVKLSFEIIDSWCQLPNLRWLNYLFVDRLSHNKMGQLCLCNIITDILYSSVSDISVTASTCDPYIVYVIENYII